MGERGGGKGGGGDLLICGLFAYMVLSKLSDLYYADMRYVFWSIGLWCDIYKILLLKRTITFLEQGRNLNDGQSRIGYPKIRSNKIR